VDVSKELKILAAALCVSSLAWAYSSSYIPYINIADTVVSANTMSHLSKHLYGIDGASKLQNKVPAKTNVASASTLVGKSNSVGVATKLAEPYPAAQRKEIERTFADLLNGYQGIERQFHIQPGDLAGAVAAFVAGNYMAYHNVDFPDHQFGPLVQQMRSIIVSNPEFQRSSQAERREMYEQMAIIGMLMASTQMALREAPDAAIAARMQEAAKRYLEQFFKADPQRLMLTNTGLMLESAR
jgi:hypothetical protein